AITGAYSNDICFGEASNSGSINLEWNGDAQNIFVSFSGGDFTYNSGLENGELNIMPLTAGTYQIEILDVCGETVTTEVEVLQLEELAITEAYPNNICFGEASNSGSINLEWTGDAQNIFVSFSGGDFSYNSDLENGQLDIMPLTAGTYQIEILDVCGETVTTEVEVLQLEELAIVDATPTDICFGEASNSGSINLEWTGDAQNIFVSFSGGDFSYNSDLENGQLDIMPLTAGTYQIEILDVCGETVTTEVEVEQFGELIINCPGDITEVSSGSYTLPDYVAEGSVITNNGCGDVNVVQSPVAGTSVEIGAHTITFTATDNSGNTATCSFTLNVNDTLSIEDGLDSSLNSLLIFPNPSDSEVTIKNSRLLSLKDAILYDLSGRKIMTFDLSRMNQTYKFDVSSLDSATYFLIINGDNGTRQFKLVVK
ncbi:T9SS type A sorting domain-containing protein, partial [Mangrovimonas sp. CR14]|uniref:T9SS type A sorting domain-containing protein n=1 Tax=Mangrovimonas sp. CR14 TaxID=2706120 RepID=UPI00197CBDB3